jgi:hypothetical protein
MVTVECDDCMVTTWTYGDAHEAIAAWNRRASPDEHLLRQAAEAREVMLRAWQWMADNEKYVFAASESAWKQMTLIAPDLRAAEAALAAALRQRIGDK